VECIVLADNVMFKK